MKVRELIEMLKKCDPDAVVCVEANCDPKAEVVGEYFDRKRRQRYAYIADNLSYIDEECEDTLTRCVDGGVHQYVEYNEDRNVFVCPTCKVRIANYEEVMLHEKVLPDHCYECGTLLRY